MEDQQWKLLVSLLHQIAIDSNISNEEIARRTGLHSSNISRMWSLKYCHNLKTFILVSEACGYKLTLLKN